MHVSAEAGALQVRPHTTSQANLPPKPAAGKAGGNHQSLEHAISARPPQPATGKTSAVPLREKPAPSRDSFTPTKADGSKMSAAKDLRGTSKPFTGVPGAFDPIGSGVKGLMGNLAGHQDA